MAEARDGRVAVSLQSEKHRSFGLNFPAGLGMIKFRNKFLQRVVAAAHHAQCTCSRCRQHFLTFEITRGALEKVQPNQPGGRDDDRVRAFARIGAKAL